MRCVSYPALLCTLVGFTQSGGSCLNPALSWLYPAHTGQVTFVPDAQWNSEASEANGTVSRYSVRPTWPWLTGGLSEPEVLSVPVRPQTPNCLWLHLTPLWAATKTTTTTTTTTTPCVCAQPSAGGLVPAGELGEGNSASAWKWVGPVCQLVGRSKDLSFPFLNP